MRRGWWRSNAWALIALALLIPAVVVTVGANEWSDYFSGRPSQPIDVRAGDSAGAGDAEIGPASAEFSTDDTLTVPDGMRVVVASIHVDPGDPAIGCVPLVLRESSGAQRQWDEASLEVGWPYDAEDPTSCASDATGPYTLVTPFLVPDDARGPFSVELVTGKELPRFVRLAIVP